MQASKPEQSGLTANCTPYPNGKLSKARWRAQLRPEIQRVRDMNKSDKLASRELERGWRSKHLADHGAFFWLCCYIQIQDEGSAWPQSRWFLYDHVLLLVRTVPLEWLRDAALATDGCNNTARLPSSHVGECGRFALRTPHHYQRLINNHISQWCEPSW